MPIPTLAGYPQPRCRRMAALTICMDEVKSRRAGNANKLVDLQIMG